MFTAVLSIILMGVIRFISVVLVWLLTAVVVIGSLGWLLGNNYTEIVPKSPR